MRVRPCGARSRGARGASRQEFDSPSSRPGEPRRRGRRRFRADGYNDRSVDDPSSDAERRVPPDETLPSVSSNTHNKDARTYFGATFTNTACVEATLKNGDVIATDEFYRDTAFGDRRFFVDIVPYDKPAASVDFYDANGKQLGHTDVSGWSS